MITGISVRAQAPVLNKYGLLVIENRKDLETTIAADPAMALVDLSAFIPSLRLELKYAGNDNFMKRAIYPRGLATTYLRRPAALAVKRVQDTLLKLGLTLKIWDAYRPYSATETMWKLVQDDRYAADPKYGSGHNRGIAVDLTIVNLSTGKELDMGTGFDNFSDTAHIGFTSLPDKILLNRRLLQDLMELNGFKVLDTEWWHFYLPASKEYALLNLPFHKLKQVPSVIK